MALAYFPQVPSARDSLSIRFHTIAQSEIKKKRRKRQDHSETGNIILVEQNAARDNGKRTKRARLPL